MMNRQAANRLAEKGTLHAIQVELQNGYSLSLQVGVAVVPSAPPLDTLGGCLRTGLAGAVVYLYTIDKNR